jgi:hypothetical protein
MFSAILILLSLPILDLGKLKGMEFKPLLKAMFFIFVANFVILMVLGAKHVESPYIELGQISAGIYFCFFVYLIPSLSILGNISVFVSNNYKNLFIKNGVNPVTPFFIFKITVCATGYTVSYLTNIDIAGLISSIDIGSIAKPICDTAWHIIPWLAKGANAYQMLPGLIEASNDIQVYPTRVPYYNHLMGIMDNLNLRLDNLEAMLANQNERRAALMVTAQTNVTSYLQQYNVVYDQLLDINSRLSDSYLQLNIAVGSYYEAQAFEDLYAIQSSRQAMSDVYEEIERLNGQFESTISDARRFRGFVERFTEDTFYNRRIDFSNVILRDLPERF